MKLIFRFIPAIVLFFSVTACSDSDLKGSCNAITGSDGSKMCIEYYNSENLSQWQMTCGPVMQGFWSQEACNKSGALGGCQINNGNAIIWLFPSKNFKTSRQVEEFCMKKNGVFQSQSPDEQ